MVDSLALELNNLAEDSLKVNLLIRLSSLSFGYSNPESTKFAEKALELAKKIDFVRGEARALHRISNLLVSQGQLDSALTLIKQAKIKSLLLHDSVLYGKNLLTEGGVLSKKSQDSKAMELFFIALEIGKRHHDFKLCANSANSLANVNLGLGHYNEAGTYFNQSLTFAEDLDDPKLIVKACINLAILNDSLDIIRFYIEKALAIALEHENMNRELTYAYNTLGGMHYWNLNQVDSALYYKKMALARAKASSEPTLIQMISRFIADIYSENDLLDSAAYYYETLLQDTVVKTYSHFHDITLRNLSEIRYKQGRANEGYLLLDSSYTLAEDRYRENMDNKVSEANAKYETEKKEAQITQQQLKIERQKNTQNKTIFGGLLALLLASSIFIWYYSRSRRKKREAELALVLEQKEADELRDLDMMKSRFFTNISHELRTPLTLITGPLEYVLENVSADSIKTEVTAAHSNGKKLLALVDEILDLSKLESGKLVLQNSETKLFELIKRIFYSFNSFAQIHDVPLVLDYQADKFLLVELDIIKFEKILNNLISNAIKHSDKNETVTMVVEQNNATLRVAVEDTGSGIHPDDIDKIFDRFYQSHREGTPLMGGTGVGLALAKELAKLFGGELHVSSRLDEGSTFTLEMPLTITGKEESKDEDVVSSTETQPEEVTDTHYSPIFLKGEKAGILIVEDNPEMSAYLKRILSPDYNCTIANDGMEALQLVQKQTFDLISSDVMMPHMDGFAFREKVKLIPKVKYTPFVMITARALEEDKLLGLQLGVDDYIIKPFNAKELLARIHNLLSNKQERDKWIKENSDNPEIELNNETAERQILKQAERAALKNISNVEFKVNDLAKELNYSGRQLRRVIKKLTGLSTVNFILEIRLQKAFQLLERKQYQSVAEVRYEIGIASASYFTTSFKKRFGRNPGDMME